MQIIRQLIGKIFVIGLDVNELLYLDQLLTDWCQWDDTYEFTYDKNSDYIESNLQDDTFYSASLNLLYIFNNDQELIWGEVFDLA